MRHVMTLREHQSGICCWTSGVASYHRSSHGACERRPTTLTLFAAGWDMYASGGAPTSRLRKLADPYSEIDLGFCPWNFWVFTYSWRNFGPEKRPHRRGSKQGKPQQEGMSRRRRSPGDLRGPHGRKLRDSNEAPGGKSERQAIRDIERHKSEARPSIEVGASETREELRR